MTELGNVLDSEFSDELLGAMSDEELQGMLERAPIGQKRRLVKRVKRSVQQTSAATIPNNSRGELQRRISQLPADIQQGLRNRHLQAVDAAFYLCKDISGQKSIKMLKDDDNKVVGICNISRGKLEKGNIFLLNGIILLSGIAAVGETAGDVNYDVLPAGLRNGEFELRANGTTLFSNIACEVFQTTGTHYQKGFYRLDNPKIIRDQQNIEFNVEWASPAKAQTYMKLVLLGTSVMKN